MMKQLELQCDRLNKIIYKANNPINMICCRCNCWEISFKNVFHSNDQLEHMLQKNFDGRKFSVKAEDGIKLDCMFFPFNNEIVKTVDELREENINLRKG